MYSEQQCPRNYASVTMGDVLSLAHITELAQSFERAKVLLAAVELDLFTALADGPLDRDALRERIGIDERGARDFFDALVALGLLVRDRDGRYANTEATNTYLDRDKSTYIGALMEDLNSRYYRVWGGLTAALRTGQSQGGAQATGDFPTLYADETALRRFARSQAARSLPVAKALAAKFPWSQYSSVIDVGTSQGCVPVQVALAHPHIIGGGFDLPQLHELFDAYVAKHGLSDRLRFHPGDFLKHPLPSADVLILGRVLHNWGRSDTDDAAEEGLRRNTHRRSARRLRTSDRRRSIQRGWVAVQLEHATNEPGWQQLYRRGVS